MCYAHSLSETGYASCSGAEMVVCSVSSCRVNQRQNRQASFFRLPKDHAVRDIWIAYCSKEEGFNLKQTYICSKHFLEGDSDENNEVKRSLVPGTRPLLKKGAVPNQHLPFERFVGRL